MTHLQGAPEPLIRTISLSVERSDVAVDRPTVAILVDGERMFETTDRRSFIGFDPDAILTAALPLLPGHDAKRIAVHTCSCGIAGCGVIAPVIDLDDDGNVTWSDFRDYTGVFTRPTDGVGDSVGKPLALEPLVFDRTQYEREVERATADRSWESTGRRTARSLAALVSAETGWLAGQGVVFGWAEFAYWQRPDDTWRVEVHESLRREEPGAARQFIADLRVTSPTGDPEADAENLFRRLRGTPVREWSSVSPIRR
ncbi:hypothetical protein [Herbiconiux sp. YIM B11900]|uniref:hypothetical protein n=1 Tax=Herbiconiux sp. YIM B11900 TaxID=3404131 RepID=UPI003F833809